MALLSRKNLLTPSVLKKEKVVLEIAESGEEEFVYVRQMTAMEKSTFEMSQLEKVGKGKDVSFNVNIDNYRAKLAVVTVCDEEGTLMFSPDDYVTLANCITAEKLEKIADMASKLNGITKEDQEELTKN